MTNRFAEVPSNARVAWMWLLLLWPVEWAWSCDDPARHPGMAEFNELRESLRSQPRGPVALRYKIAKERLPGQPIAVEVSFWPMAPYDQGSFSMTASPRLELSGLVDGQAIPYKGSAVFSVTALHTGYHHLIVTTEVTRDEVRSSRRFAIAVPVEPAHSSVTALVGDQALGFAGPRMKKVLTAKERPEQ